MRVYYNEFDNNAAQWLRNLGAANLIASGEIDERSIKEVQEADLAGARRAHFFAGIGGWDLALKLAGWPEDREVWTGSCPCQPFSSAGKGAGEKDERHLWPDFLRLIAERLPATIFGEQVASKAGRGWVTRVRLDLEALGYRVGVADLCAASVGAPHIRQRLYWVADRLHAERRPQHDYGQDGCDRQDGRRQEAHSIIGACSEIRRIPDGEGDGLEELQNAGRCGEGEERDGQPGFIDGRDVVGLGNGNGKGQQEHREQGGIRPPDERGAPTGLERTSRALERLADGDEGLQDGRQGRPEPGRVALSPWSDFRIVPCTDGKARRTGARVFPLAYGLPRGVGQGSAGLRKLGRSASRSRIGILKGSGNAIVPELAAEFVTAYMDATFTPSPAEKATEQAKPGDAGEGKS